VRATPMQPARHTAYALLYLRQVPTATTVLASYGSRVAGHQLGDNALDLKSALKGIREALDHRTKAACAERVTDDWRREIASPCKRFSP